MLRDRPLLPAAAPSSWRAAHCIGLLAGEAKPSSGVGTEGTWGPGGDGTCTLLATSPLSEQTFTNFKNGRRRRGSIGAGVLSSDSFSGYIVTLWKDSKMSAWKADVHLGMPPRQTLGLNAASLPPPGFLQ